MGLRVVDRDVPILDRLIGQLDLGTVGQVVDRRLVVAEVRSTTQLRATCVVVAGGIGITETAGRCSKGRNNVRA